MTMESVLKKLESRIEEFVELYRSASTRAAELEARVSELEEQLAGPAKVEDKVKKLEAQRSEMAGRLEKVLGVIDAAIEEAE